MYLVLFCIMNMNILYYVVTYQSSSQNREITNKYVVVVVADCKLLLGCAVHKQHKSFIILMTVCASNLPSRSSTLSLCYQYYLPTYLQIIWWVVKGGIKIQSWTNWPACLLARLPKKPVKGPDHLFNECCNWFWCISYDVCFY